MSKINEAIYEIYSMDRMANRDQWMNRIHPLVKLMVTFFYVWIVVSLDKYDLSRIISMAGYPVLMFQLSQVSFKDSFRKLRVVLPLVCVVGIMNPYFDRQILFSFLGIEISGGVVSMVTLMLKGIYTVLASYLLIATTTIEKICYSLRRLHIPKLFVTQILLIYRYITLLLLEANRMTEAYSLRAPGQKGVHYKVWGSLVGQLLLRSVDRAEDIYASMCIRGYDGDFSTIWQPKARSKDYLYLFLWIGTLAVLRYLPVLNLIGMIFL